MIKRIIGMTVTGVLLSWLLVSGFNLAYATPSKCPPGQEKKGWKCVDIVDPGQGGGDIDITNSNSNKNTNMNINSNSNYNSNKNTNVNVNSNKANANSTAIQGQAQFQGQTANNEGVNNSVVVEGDTVNYVEQPNHINPVSGPDTDVNTTRSRGHDALTFGSVMDHIEGLDLAGIKMLAKDASDVEIKTAVFFEPENSVNYVRVSSDGRFAGFLYATCDDDGCSAAGMEGVAMKSAAKLGYTSIERVHVSDGEKLYASEWSLKLGGGASVAANGGSMIIAPGGGIGGGKAETSTLNLPAMVFKVYYNPLYINID